MTGKNTRIGVDRNQEASSAPTYVGLYQRGCRLGYSEQVSDQAITLEEYKRKDM